ncbi:MAG: sigma-70 family RNA polymerase sigma factor, partial [Myxococcales bacterium]|nr:sigma-70 family RNA polymerase sigma factor [Myxococcales bacterium]
LRALPIRPLLPGGDLVAAQAGNPMALDRLMRRHWHAIERICRRMCPADDSFEDLRQDVFIALIRALPGYRGQASFITWAYTIVRTCRGRRLRKGRTASEMARPEGVEPDEHEAFDDCIANHELVERLDQALAHLSVTDRTVLVLRDLEGYSAEEVARTTGLTVPAVKTRLHRARVAMRAELGSVA